MREVWQMTRFCRAAPFIFAVLFLAAQAHSVRAQDLDAIATTGRIRISYEPPSDAKFRPVYDLLRRRQALERLQAFLAPLRLPRPLTIRVAQCGAETMPYKPGGPVTICYEMVQRINDIAVKNTKDANEQALIRYGTFVESTLHDVAYAVFDLLQVPIWGREDDAADRLAALTMLQFGDKVALTTIIGTAKFFEYSNHTWTGADFAAEESPEAQRFYNYLCIAYGGDPITFHFLTPRPGPSAVPRLSAHRAPRCAREYQQVRHAFDQRIMPFVDPDSMIKVRASQWLLSDEIPRNTK
jgi:Putative metallopeptidase